MTHYCRRCGHFRELDRLSFWCRVCMAAAGYGFNPPVTGRG